MLHNFTQLQHHLFKYMSVTFVLLNLGDCSVFKVKKQVWQFLVGDKVVVEFEALIVDVFDVRVAVPGLLQQ